MNNIEDKPCVSGSTPLAHVLLQLKKNNNSKDYEQIKEAISNLEKFNSNNNNNNKNNLCITQSDEIKMENNNDTSDIFVFSALNGIESTETCNCKKSQCLKLYCQCFAAKFTCTSSCRCVSCENTSLNSDVRQRAVHFMLERNPNAFDSKYKVPISSNPSAIPSQVIPSSSSSSAAHKVGCKCRKSKCLKKYCECYEGAVACSNMCICVACENPVNFDSSNNNNNNNNNSTSNPTDRPPPPMRVCSDESDSNPPPPIVGMKRPPLAPTNNNNNNAPLKLARKQFKEEELPTLKPTTAMTPSSQIPSEATTTATTTSTTLTPSSISVASALALLSSSIAHEQRRNPHSLLATPNSLQIAHALAFLSQSFATQEPSPNISQQQQQPTPNTLSIASALALLSNSLEKSNNNNSINNFTLYHQSSPLPIMTNNNNNNKNNIPQNNNNNNTIPQNKENICPEVSSSC